MVLQILQRGVGNATNAHLQGAAVVYERGDVPPNLAFDFVGRPDGFGVDGGIFLNEKINLGCVHQTVAKVSIRFPTLRYAIPSDLDTLVGFRLVAVRRPAYRAQPANVRPIPLAASGSLSVNEA